MNNTNNIIGDPNIFNLTDEELVSQIMYDIDAYTADLATIIKRKAEGKKYYLGDQVDNRQLQRGDSENVVNKIFSAVEHSTSMSTDVTPLPWIIVTPNDNGGKVLEEKLNRKVRDDWEVEQKMQKVSEIMTRNRKWAGVAIAKYYIDPVTSKRKTRYVPLENLSFDPSVTEFEELPFIVEKQTTTIGDLIEDFPDKKEEILEINKGLRSEVTKIEYWSKYREDGEYHTGVAWMFDKLILGKEKDENWNSGKNAKNHFEKPEFPYIAYTVLSDGESFVDMTTEVEQAIPLQDSVNRRKRQIDKNARLANGKYVVSSEAMTKAEAEEIPLKDFIYLDGDVENIDYVFRMQHGRALEGGVYQDYADSKNEVDNMLGIHAATRGERIGNDTASRASLLKESDRDRLDPEVRAFNDFAEEWYKAQIQMMMVHMDKENILTSKEIVNAQESSLESQGLRAKGKQVEMQITREELAKYDVTIIVKRNAVRPRDPSSLANDAITLMQTGNLNPKSFFEMVGIPEGNKHARWQYLYQTNPAALFPELSGPDVLHPIALDHIVRINKGDVDHQSLLLDPNDDVEEHGKYVNTLVIYLTSGNIDPDIDEYQSLEREIQNNHIEHLQFAKGLLQTKVEQQQAQMQQQTQMQQSMGMAGQAPQGQQVASEPNANINVPV